MDSNPNKSSIFTENDVEAAALAWLTVPTSPAPGELLAERQSFEEVTLKDRLRAALARLNPRSAAGSSTGSTARRRPWGRRGPGSR